MNMLKSEDGDVSERELLVDDIQRIREVLHISAGHVRLSSDEEEEDEESEEEDEEDDEREKLEEHNIIGLNSNNLQYQNVNCAFPLGIKSNIPSSEELCEGEVIREQSLLNGGEEAFHISDSNHLLQPLNVLPVQPLIDNNLMPSQSTGNASADEYVLTELQPRGFEPPPCVPSTSQSVFSSDSWQVELNHFQGQNDDYQQQQEREDLYHDGDGNDNSGDPEMRGKIQQCLTLNRDYQLAILDELERIELALAKNREKQYGLHQMRVNRDEVKPEPHTLIKFANPYFKDSSSVGPPDNEDTKIKRQSNQVGGYVKSRFWRQKEENSLAEGVRMQNLEYKLSPILQKIQKLELKNVKTASELRELDELKAESSRIRTLPKDKLEHGLEGIDWDRISSTYLPKRTGFQCRLQWCNFGHPDVNQAPWTKEEDKMLIKLAKEPGNTWDIIAQKLQTRRTPIHCYERYQRSLNKDLLKSKWTPEDDEQLLEVVRIVGLGNWPRVASFLEGRQGDQCMHRYTQTLQMVKKGKWHEDEDELLKKAVAKYGACNWYKIAEMVPGRSGPQCRERWVNGLDPKIEKGPWSKEHDQKLLENVEKFGRGNWSKIARALGTRTDNQCWRRWIVLRKDESLYYRQNTLRKKRELVANFTGRRQERPSLNPEDLDIPDVPVVRKRKGPVPLPIEESRARRRATRARFREKKRAEKREAERREAEKTKGEEQSKEVTPSKESNIASGDSEDENNDGGSDEQEGSSESKKSPHVRKAGGNRSRVQQPHHRVLMKNKQLSKRKQVAEKREKRHSKSPSREKQVTVSGSLGPFSLLLQAFSIDIPTVLQAIQNTSTAPSTSTPSTVTAATENTPVVDENSSGDQQTRMQAGGDVDGQESQQTGASGNFANSQSSAGTEVAACGQKNQEKAQEFDNTSISKGECSEIDKQNKANKITETDSTVRAEISSEVSNSVTPSAHAHAGNESAAAKPATSTVTSTNQAARRRAPAIPPLPPCFTTLKTFKSLLLLRPQLQQLAAMLNTAPADSTAGSISCQPSSTASAAGRHSDRSSGVTCVSGNEARDITNDSPDVEVESSENCEEIIESGKDVEPGKLIIDLSRDSETIENNDQVVSPGRTRDTPELGKQPPTSSDDVTEGRLSADDPRLAAEDTQMLTNNKTGSQQQQISDLSSHEINNGAEATSSSGDSSLVQSSVAPTTTVRSKDKNSRPLDQNRSHENATSNASGIRIKNISYRNSYEYKMLSSRFSSLFLWPALLSKIPVRGSSQIGPALLSKIPVRGSSQIGPVFAERHPPPRVGDGDSSKRSVARKRKPAGLREKGPNRCKRPGLAAVRMASSASFSTPGQQMCIVGQGSAIRTETPETQPDEQSGASDVVLAASQLVSLSKSSTVGSSPYNTRKNKRKATPVKRSSNQTSNTSPSKRGKVIEISDSFLSSEDDFTSEDDSALSDYSPPKRSTRKTGALKSTRSTRQTSSLKAEVSTASDAQLTSNTQATLSTATGQAANANETTPTQVVISSDSTEETQPSLQEGTVVTSAPGDDTAGQPSGAAANQSSPTESKTTKNESPSSSTKRKTSKPEKNRGARWRAMLPKVDDPDESDVE